jgi:hypothetical protein
MVIEMLLNNDIKFLKIILHFQKEINVIMYIIGTKINSILIISFGQNLDKI